MVDKNNDNHENSNDKIMMMLNKLLACKDEVVDVSPVIQGGPLEAHVISGQDCPDCSQVTIAQMTHLMSGMEKTYLETGDQAIVSRFIGVLNQIKDMAVIVKGLQGLVECGVGLVCLTKQEPQLRGYLEALSTPIGCLGDKTVKDMILGAKTQGKTLLEIAFDNAYVYKDKVSELAHYDKVLVALYDHGADPGETFSNEYTARELLRDVFDSDALPRCRARLNEGGST